MSRIGKLPITIPQGVTVTVKPGVITVKGPLGELKQTYLDGVAFDIKDNQIVVTRKSENKEHKAQHGLYRVLINNMIEGVTKGYKKQLELIGVGYKAEAKGQMLELSLGFSHSIYFQMPPEIKVEAVTEKRGNPTITLTCIDKQLIGQVAAKIRSIRSPEPYKGKGVRYLGEAVRKKAGKTASVK